MEAKRNIDGIIYNTYRTDDEMADYLRQISEQIPIVYMNKILGEEEKYFYVYTVQGLTDCGLPLEEKWVYRVQKENEPDYVNLGRDAARQCD